MIMSMTGFASHLATIENESGSATQISISIKSLNSRFFETNNKLPYALAHLETECIKLFKQSLHRGYITFIVQANNSSAFKGSVQVDANVAKNYINACNELQKQFNIPGQVTISDILQIPAIFSSEEQKISTAAETTILNAIKKTLENLVNVRLQEGRALQKDLELRDDNLQNIINSVEAQAHHAMEKRKKEIIAHVAALNHGAEELNETQRTTLFLELNKIDIGEEIVRFKSHLVTFKDTLLSAETEKGRKLDFVVQELGREINTIGAKCNDDRISALVINGKVELEKAREQIQNIV